MGLLPKLKEYGGRRDFLEAFMGYDHNLKTNEGTWFDEMNLTAAEFPVFSTRKRRGVVSQLTAPAGLAEKDALAYVDGADLVYNGYTVHMELSTAASMKPKQLVSMGAYLLIWPDKKYLNTADLTDFGAMENSVTLTSDISVTLCRADGSGYGNYVQSVTAPEAPADKDYWMDIGEEKPVLKQWNESTGMWVSIATTYLKIASAGIDTGFKQWDGVTVSGFTNEALNSTYVLQAVGEGYIVVIGILQDPIEQTGGVSIERSVPPMDYVTECDNRIWGCKYGLVGGKTVNEIYACKLGDFKNWNCFMGLSTDSYAASRGSDGVFTGAATLQGHPLFFKENYIEKVYPSSTGAHQIVTAPARGVQKGCWRSLQVVGEVLYYKGTKDVCAYTGSLPVAVSEALGEDEWSDARAGAVGEVYYIAMKDRNGAWTMFTYDTAKRIWHKEDAVKPMAFAVKDGELYYIDEESSELVCVSGAEGTEETSLAWMAESGVIGFEQAGQKYISRFVFRAELEKGAELRLEIRYDEGPWQKRGCFTRPGLGSFVLPVMPRRCDHLRIRLSGHGGVKIYSMAKYLEQGSDRVRR